MIINVAAVDQNTERIIDQEMSASLSDHFGDDRPRLNTSVQGSHFINLFRPQL